MKTTLSSTFNVDQFPHPNPYQTVPITVHPTPVHEPALLTNILVLKQQGARRCTLTYSAHFVCHHPGYAHTLAALVTTNVLTAATHVTYPKGYCYVITEEQASNSLARFNARNQPTNPTPDSPDTTEETPEPPTPSPINPGSPTEEQ
jgi:hypothetical protein